MDNYVPLREACKLLGLQPTTIRSWAKNNTIKTIKTPSGQFLYSRKAIDTIINGDNDVKEKQKIIYARVSSEKQKDDLERQIVYLRSKYPNHHLIKDCGSGINWKRKGLLTILEQTMSGLVDEIVVAHKDRLCRFGYELVQWIIESNGAKLIVMDEEHDHQTGEQELAEDLLSIVHIYSCKQMGKRRYSKSHEDKTKDEL